ncbi:MAG: phosphate ABC transporter permease PstA [Nocardioidaceae bacterium]
MTRAQQRLRAVDDEAILGKLDSSLRARALPRRTATIAAVAAALLATSLHVVWGLGVAIAVVVCWAAYVVGLTTISRIVEGARKSKDRLATNLVVSAFGLALLPLASLLWKVVSNGAPVLNATFLTNSMRNVVGPGGGIYHAAAGTLLVTAMAALISVPIGLLTAIYLVEYSDGALARAITFLVDVMTGIPSIVAALFAYALFVVFFGAGVRMGLGGAVALSVLMVPLVVRSAEEMLKLVPTELREASYALGVSKWRTIVKVVTPTAMAGIVTGITIAVARVIGETAPLLIICGATDSTNFNLLNGRIMTLPVYIYGQYKNPGIPPQFSEQRAWGAALVLTIIIMALSLVARLVSHFLSPKTRA